MDNVALKRFSLMTATRTDKDEIKRRWTQTSLYDRTKRQPRDNLMEEIGQDEWRLTVNVFVTVYLPLFPLCRYDSPIRFAYYLYYDLPPCPVTTLCVQVEHTVNGFWMIHDHLIDDQRSWSFVNLLWLLIVSTKRPLTSSTALRCRLCDRWHHRENNNCVDETLLLSVVVINSTGISVVVPCRAEYSSGPWKIA